MDCVEGLRNRCACLLSSSWENIEGSLLVMSPLSLAPDPSADNSVAGMSRYAFVPCSNFFVHSVHLHFFVRRVNQLSRNKNGILACNTCSTCTPSMSLVPAGFWTRYHIVVASSAATQYLTTRARQRLAHY